MPETRLQLVNSTLALLGESALLNTSGTLGQLVVTALNSALVKVVQETRASVFEQVLTGNVTSEDYLVSSLTLPDNTIQVFSVFLRISTGVSTGDKLIPLEYSNLEELQEAPRYSVIGRELFVSPMIARPFTLRVHVLTLPQLPSSDGVDSGVPDIVLPAVRHAAASILYASYLDDANGSAIQRNLATELIEKLRNQYGNFRAKSFNMGKAIGNNLSFGGFSTITTGLSYAPLTSPAFNGTPTAPTPATANNSTQLATTAYVQANLANYSTTAAIAAGLANYLTTASAASTYLTIPNAASTYLSITAANSTFAPLASPALTGVPTAPTAAFGTNTTQLATTAFVLAQALSSTDSLGGRYFKIGSYLIKFGTSVVSLSSNNATINIGGTPTFSSTPIYVVCNGDSGINHAVYVNNATSNATTLGITSPTLPTGSYRVNWVALGVA